jgi:hypothetical protein
MRRSNDRSIMQRAGTAAIIFAAAGGVLAAGSALAQRDRSLEVDVAECVEIESPAERFRCYESRVDAALDAAEPPAPDEAPPAESSSPASGSSRASSSEAPAPIPEREIAAERAAAPDDFGLRQPDERESGEEGGEQQEFFGTIASLRETVPNRYIITLENGQVWRQMRPTFYPLRPGHRVRIYSTNWGDSFRMSSDELNGFIQVERVR